MIPLKLTMKNFLSHKESEIDFTKFDVALIVGTFEDNTEQSNGAGKSAIFEAIQWVLFDRSRHRKKDGVVKRDAKSCTVEFLFSVNEDIYRVVRKRDKVIGESDVIFEQILPDKVKPLTGDNDTLTNKKIVSTIGVNADVFTNSVYFRQNDISAFAESRPGQRKDTLKALLHMEMWDKYQKRAKDKAGTLRAQIDAKSGMVIDIEDIRNDLEKCSNSISEFKIRMQELDVLYEQTSNVYFVKKAYFDSVYTGHSTPEDLKRLQKEYSVIKKRIQEIDTIKESNNETITKNAGGVAMCDQHLRKYDGIIKDAKDIDIESIRKKLANGRTKERLYAQQVSNIEKVLGSDNEECYACKRPTKGKEKDHIVDHLGQAKTAYDTVKKMLSEYEKVAKDKEQKVELANDAKLKKEKVKLKLSKLQGEIDRLMSENTQMDKESQFLDTTKIESEIERLKIKLDKDESERLENELSELDSKLDAISKKRDKLNIDLGSLVSQKKELVAKEQEQIMLLNELNKLKSEFAIYDKLKTHFGKEGVQSVIIENVIGELEDYANNTLSKICNEPTSLKIQTQRENEKGSWAETFDIEVTAGNRTDEVETFSGGEKFRISFALRLALSKILSKRMGGALQFLLLDEVSSSLDSKGLQMFIDIVKQLGDELKIMVITHDEKLKEMFDDIIIVNKGADGSAVKMVA